MRAGLGDSGRQRLAARKVLGNARRQPAAFGFAALLRSVIVIPGRDNPYLGIGKRHAYAGIGGFCRWQAECRKDGD
jgi:hypothetical protein